MKSIHEILVELESDNSRNAKIAILKENSDNSNLKRAFHLALNPLINFYIKKIPQYSHDPAKPSIDLGYAMDELSKLSNRDVTGNAGIQFLSNLLGSLDPEDAEVIKRIIAKDLKCGAARASVNSVWPNLIPEYPVMLCAQFEQKLVDKINWPAAVQLKMDGMRFNAIVVNGKCEFRSRNGKELNLLGRLEQEFISISSGHNMVFDGELLVDSGSGVADRQTGNGILNKALKGTISETEADSVVATIWDVIPYESFVAGSDTQPYLIRLQSLEQTSLPSNIRMVETQIVDSYDRAQEIFQVYLDQGQEGIILKDLSGTWQSTRAKHQIKFKGELECDLKVVSTENGTGKYEGMIGALVCESSDGVIKVSVGSGLTDQQRKATDLVGKVVSVKYNSRIKNRSGDQSLFLPIFIEIREDKFEADASKDIK